MHSSWLPWPPTIRHNVTAPAVPHAGLAWFLIEEIAAALEAAGLAHVPLLYLGPAAQDSLALASTSMEFLCR